ncbi:protein phosphatase 1 regulatory subunit 35 isoform X2 [Polyodon spathula]|uniref:protein phosphatase 1 regulatory subunit 35 isoform X1 n=1 Tax=Polyodon spathula TaxID=7913 RepID=UPI001B7D9AF4|nr:protein phosphatase 1 regulatory subunit 35 isoform X1 [Polyodon spathula]XP_041093174.1 protein phosphatase 1 regulatory subunit 35 isoform X2 [Polyodon spathula]
MKLAVPTTDCTPKPYTPLHYTDQESLPLHCAPKRPGHTVLEPVSATSKPMLLGSTDQESFPSYCAPGPVGCDDGDASLRQCSDPESRPVQSGASLLGYPESVPMRHAPTPLHSEPQPLGSLPDLDISLTPEKMSRGTGGILKRGGGGENRHRQVRFHITPQSDTSTCKESDDLSPRPEREAEPRTVTPVSGGGVRERGVDTPKPNPNPTAIFSKEGSSSRQKAPKRTAKAKAPKASDERTKSRAQQAVGETPVEAGPGVLLERPALHTTLALGAELRGVEGAEFHPRRAVLEQLRKSSLTRNIVEGKIAEAVNVPRYQTRFQALVSLAVPQQDVLSSALRERLALVPPGRTQPGKSSPAEGPDLLAFYSPCELLWETPHLPLEGLPPLRVSTRTRPPETTFNLYSKRRQWES